MLRRVARLGTKPATYISGQMGKEESSEIRARRMKWPELLMEAEFQRPYAKFGRTKEMGILMMEIRRRILQTQKNNSRNAAPEDS